MNIASTFDMFEVIPFNCHLRRHSFGDPDAVFSVNNLSVQIAHFDTVKVDYANVT
jgi:hypothetical protein